MANTVQWPSNEEFIAKYEELKSSRKMGEYYNCNKTSILNHAKQIGYDVNSNKAYKLSEQDKKDIIAAYETETSTELAKKYNVSRGMITKIWYDNNLSGKKVENTQTTKIDLTGQKFGYLTVLKESPKRGSNGNIFWWCKCEKCGTEREISGATLRNGKVISCGCVSKDNLKLGRGLNFQNLTGQKFGKLTVIERVEDARGGQVQWLCQCDCGNQSTVMAENLKKGNTQSCGYCNENSHGNIKIEAILKENNIPFIREKRFESCKDKTYLPFDFYVNNKYLIEYDGIQHFKITGWGADNFESTQLHDKIKNQWCKDNNIPLIRIPYTHYEDLCLDDLLLDSSQFIVQ